MFYIVLIFVGLITGCFCSIVANEKGYSESSWFILGFLFSFPALIAVAGLPDRKLRKYLRQIGVKQKAINEESEPSEEKIVYGKRTISFVMPSRASKLQIFNKLKSEVKKNLEYEKIFNTFEIKSYDFNESLLGGIEFVIEGDKEESLFIMSSKKLNNTLTQWSGNL